MLIGSIGSGGVIMVTDVGMNRKSSLLDNYSDDEIEEVLKSNTLSAAAIVFGYKSGKRNRGKCLRKQLESRGLVDKLKSKGIL